MFVKILDGDGRITGNDATKFFAFSNLSRQDLKQVYYLYINKLWKPCLVVIVCFFCTCSIF